MFHTYFRCTSKASLFLLREEMSHQVVFSKYYVGTLRMQWHSQPPNLISQWYPMDPLPCPICELFQEFLLLTTSEGVVCVLWLSDRWRFSYMAHRASICQPSLKYFRCNNRNWTASLSGLGAKVVLYMDCSEPHFTYEISLVEPSYTLFVETSQDISRNAELSNSRLMSSHFWLCFSSGRERGLQKPY